MYSALRFTIEQGCFTVNIFEACVLVGIQSAVLESEKTTTNKQTSKANYRRTVILDPSAAAFPCACNVSVTIMIMYDGDPLIYLPGVKLSRGMLA